MYCSTCTFRQVFNPGHYSLPFFVCTFDAFYSHQLPTGNSVQYSLQHQQAKSLANFTSTSFGFLIAAHFMPAAASSSSNLACSGKLTCTDSSYKAMHSWRWTSDAVRPCTLSASLHLPLHLHLSLSMSLSSLWNSDHQRVAVSLQVSAGIAQAEMPLIYK